jgi:magnesium-transporting ATPase (P-type)
MVHYIFSDKTGTLTQNIMEFKRFSCGAISYGKSNPRKIDYPPGVTNVNFEDNDFFEHMEDESHSNHQNIKKYIECLGICHTVIAEEKEDKTGKPFTMYNASSPDELALVNGARHFGFAFKERDDNSNMVIEHTRTGAVSKYELLNVIEFDSARKRMTVIVRTPDNRVMVVCKGADSIIEKRLRPGQALLKTTNQYLEDYANQGLRTLLICYKYVTDEFYQDWSK